MGLTDDQQQEISNILGSTMSKCPADLSGFVGLPTERLSELVEPVNEELVAQMLATLPNLRQKRHSFSVLARDAGWFLSRINLGRAWSIPVGWDDWRLMSCIPYDVDGYQFYRVEFESTIEDGFLAEIDRLKAKIADLESGLTPGCDYSMVSM